MVQTACKCEAAYYANKLLKKNIYIYIYMFLCFLAWVYGSVGKRLISAEPLHYMEALQAYSITTGTPMQTKLLKK